MCVDIVLCLTYLVVLCRCQQDQLTVKALETSPANFPPPGVLRMSPLAAVDGGFIIRDPRREPKELSPPVRLRSIVFPTQSYSINITFLISIFPLVSFLLSKIHFVVELLLLQLSLIEKYFLIFLSRFLVTIETGQTVTK